jgi:hypothetical protein
MRYRWVGDEEYMARLGSHAGLSANSIRDFQVMLVGCMFLIVGWFVATCWCVSLNEQSEDMLLGAAAPISWE